MRTLLIRLAMTFNLVCTLVQPSSAHEPLWGESPQTFGFGVWHPEIRFGFQKEFLLLRGATRLNNPEALRRMRFDSVLGIQYAPKTSMNVRIEIPYSIVQSSDRIGGVPRTSRTSGLGDIMLSAKSRFAQRFGEDWKEHQAYTVGLQLPTGQHGGREASGALLEPSEQPGSGKWGYSLGYAYAYERLKDTLWVSAMFMGDIGGAGSKGEMFTLDANYGYWFKRAHKPQDLGVILAAGTHYEWMGKDRLTMGAAPDTGYSLSALQVSLIATKGTFQFRAGALLPLYQHTNGTQLRPNVQMRVGIEVLL